MSKIISSSIYSVNLLLILNAFYLVLQLAELDVNCG